MLSEKDVIHLHGVVSECYEIQDFCHLKHFIQTKIRRLLPHEMALFGLGERRSRRMLRLVNVDFPADCLRPGNGCGQPVLAKPLREWLRRRTPVVVSTEEAAVTKPCARMPAVRVRSLACHGVPDVSSTAFSCFMFGNVDVAAAPSYAALLNLVVPHLHAALARLLVLEQLQRGLRDGPDGAAEPAEARGLDTAPLSEMTERERQVLQWVAAGKSNWEIGKILRISEFTVKNHVQNVLKKLAATSRAQAVTRAISCGLIRDDLLHPDVASNR